MQLYGDGLDRWLEERSDAVGALVSFIVALLCLHGSGLSSGVTGFLISTGLEFTNRILYVVRAINKNELSLNSVQRILAYSDVEQEEPETDNGKPPANWPQGEITVSLTFRKRASAESVRLRSLTTTRPSTRETDPTFFIRSPSPSSKDPRSGSWAQVDVESRR